MEKTNLIKINASKAWHYKLIKFVFKGILPDPKTIKNFCLYWWVFLASIALVIPVAAIKLIGLIFVGAFNLLQAYNDKRVEKWCKNLPTEKAYKIVHGHSNVRKPIGCKKYDYQIVNAWAIANGLDPNSPEYTVKINDIWDEVRRKRDEISAERAKEENALMRAKYERIRKRELRDEKIENVLNSVADVFKPLKKLKPSFKIKNYAQVAKAAKKVGGLLITLFVGACVFMIAQVIALLIEALILIWSWKTIGFCSAALLGAAVVILSIYGIVIGLKWIVDTATEKYHDEKKIVWYVAPFVYFAIGVLTVFEWIYVAGKYTIYYPLYFVFVLWKTVCVNLLWSLLKGFGVGIIKTTGIFGEYFGQSYTEFCPGLEWTEDEETK